jgi:minor extracellular serine protease Vpr
MEWSFKRAVRAFLLACSAFAVLATSVVGATAATSGPKASLWFIELKGAPTADGRSRDAVRAEKAAFKAEAASEKVSYKQRLSFDTLWNGISVEATPESAAALQELDSVKAVTPVRTIQVPRTAAANPDLSTAIAQTGADIAQNELGLTGAGVKVAVMDTGIDYDNLALGGDGTSRTNSSAFPNTRVIEGIDLVGDAYNADPASPAYNPNPVPDALPDDCQGHGTHVAGIVGANGGGIKGVAPGVQFGSYRVFGCDGSTTEDIMLQAMEAALADDMDILNMSIGDAFLSWPQSVTAAGSDRLVRSGMVVVASIGNSGADGVYSAGAPGVGDRVIGVASMDNSHVDLRTFTISPDNTSIGYGNATGAPAAPTSGSFPMSSVRPTTADDACDASGGVPASVAGTVVLIRRGTCTFHEKVRNAQSAGAVGAVLFNNVAGRFAPTVVGPVAITIPAVAISDTEGVLIRTRLASGPVTMTWTDQLGRFANATAGLASSFTSYGPTADLQVKPDVAAPGGLIRSSYVLEKAPSGNAVLSGTSMASPHVAGAAALILQAHPGTSPGAMRTLLQNNATPRPWFGNPALGFAEAVHRQGAGMIDIPRAVLATTTLEPSKLALGESQAGAQTRTITIRSTSSSAKTYALGNVSAIGTGNTFPSVAFFVQDRSVTFSQAGVPVTSVTVPAGGSANVDATINPAPAASEDKTVYTGFLTFTAGSEVSRVPYVGFIGDYQSLVVLQPGAANAFPAIGRLTGDVSATDLTDVHTPVVAGAVFTMVGDNDKPYVLAHFAHQARSLRVELFNAATNARVGEALRTEYLKRNSRRTGTTNDTNSDVYQAFLIDGMVKKGKSRVAVPDGSYYAVVTVLKALGDAANPAHSETWTSPAFTIDRP